MSDAKREVDELRQEIAKLDAQLLVTLEKRAKAARRIGEVRKDQPALHIIVTGRDAPQELIEAADLVTEMTEIKHPLQAGIRAQRGIEF